MRARFGGDLIAAVVTPLLLVIVAFPLLFVGLQAIFPGVARADFAAPFTAAREALADPRLWVWTGNSAALGISVAIVSALLAIPLGMLRGLCRVPLAPLWDVLFLIPFAIPPYIAALGWIMTLQPRGYLQQVLGVHLGPFLFSFPGVVFVMTLNVFPVVYFAVSRTVAAIGARYEEAARVCGASPWTAFRTVTLPLSTPAIAASLLLVFAMAIEEFGTPYVLASRSGFTVLVTGIERKLSDFPIDLPGAATLSVVLMALAATAFLVQLRLVSRRDFQTVAGKPRPGAARSLGAWTLPVLLAFAAVAFLGAVVPIAAVALTGSTRTISGGLAWSNFSTVHFEAILADRAGAMAALRTSLLLGIGAALATGVIGALTAHVVVRQRSRAGRLLDLLTLLPSATPGIVVAVGLILAWTQPWLPVTPYNTVWVLLIAYCCLLLPYPVRYANAALRQIAPSLEDAARVCGAGPVTSFTRIVLPLIAPSLIAAMLLVFAIAARELVATVLLAPLGARTVALFIWRQFEQGSVGLGMAMSTLAIAITVTIPVAVAAWARRKGVGG